MAYLPLIIIFFWTTFGTVTSASSSDYACYSRNTSWCQLEEIKDLKNASGKINVVGSSTETSSITSVFFLEKKVTNFPVSICEQFLNLQIFDASNQELTTLHTSYFYNCSSLKELSLKANKIKTLGYRSFRGNRNLQSLDLSYNRLTRLNRNAFSGLDKLVTLNLTANRIYHLIPENLGSLTSLKVLSLSCNFIYEIDIERIQNTIHLNQIGIHHNLLDCGSLINLIEKFKHQLKFVPENCTALHPYSEIISEDDISCIDLITWKGIFKVPIIDVIKHVENNMNEWEEEVNEKLYSIERKFENFSTNKSGELLQTVDETNNPDDVVVYGLAGGFMIILIIVSLALVYYVRRKQTFLRNNILIVERRFKAQLTQLQKSTVKARKSSSSSSSSSSE